MLEKLLHKGISLGIFELKLIKDLPKSSASKANVEVIDYDLVKEKLYREMNGNHFKFNQPKSCDALKIITQENRVDFIEIKGVKAFCDSLQRKEKCNVDKEIEKQISKFGLEEKIEQSFDILKLLLQIDQFEFKNSEKKWILNDTIKDYLVVIDEEIEQDYSMRIAANLDFLSTTSNYTEQVIIQLQETISGLSYIKIRKPKLISHSQLDNYYGILSEVVG